MKPIEPVQNKGEKKIKEEITFQIIIITVMNIRYDFTPMHAVVGFENGCWFKHDFIQRKDIRYKCVRSSTSIKLM